MIPMLVSSNVGRITLHMIYTGAFWHVERVRADKCIAQRRCRRVLQVGAPGTMLYGRKRRTRKEDKIVLDLYVGTKFIDWE
jgi:hypothetical protein